MSTASLPAIRHGFPEYSYSNGCSAPNLPGLTTIAEHLNPDDDSPQAAESSPLLSRSTLSFEPRGYGVRAPSRIKDSSPPPEASSLGRQVQRLNGETNG
ncbi:hypothetical protein GcM3_060009 [Golovinomyces cichoracearum]|uniref:Uncharacterized protein n=1 Tax=Golovinomyces cichoracearum TaxID=62708 RepID=A0A420IWP7_9PEZI|nr:hypothetical protein GcM3_060009 [Golovinomyces cichoracearum]